MNEDHQIAPNRAPIPDQSSDLMQLQPVEPEFDEHHIPGVQISGLYPGSRNNAFKTVGVWKLFLLGF